MSPNTEPVIITHQIATGRYAHACQYGTEEQRLAARQNMAAARVFEIAKKVMAGGTPPLSRAQIAEITRVLKGGA